MKKAHSSLQKNMIPRALVAASLAAGLSLSPLDRGNAAAADSAPPKGDSAEAQVGSVVTGAKRSQHFGAVSKHLDLGGTVYGYIDIDGDVEKLAEMLQGFLDIGKQQAGDDMPPHLKSLDLGKVFADLGLDGIEAIGMSSIKKGELYHNKAYAHVPAGRKGLLKVLGGDAIPFVAKQLAPADSDLILEQSLNIRAGYDVFSAMVMRFGGPEASKEFQSKVGEVMPEIGVSIAEIFGKLDTRLTIIGRVHPDKPLELPDVPMKVPSFDLLIALDDTGWLFDKIIAQGKKEVPPEQQKEMFAAGEGFEKIMAPPLPSPDMVMMQPVIYHDHASKRVLIASTQAFLDECLSEKPKIGSDQAFQTAMTGLPAEGNGLTYASAEFVKAYRDLIQAAVKNSPMGAAELAITSLLDRALPDTKVSQASVTVNTAEGILSVANSASSLKDGMVMGGAGVLAGLGGALFAVKEERSIPFEDDEPLLIEEIPGAPAIPDNAP